MSSSFVPKVSMSKGTSKKTKFDVSCNTHTTAEVGYLQPTFSKLLMPNSDLSIKVNDSILMSSLVVPTFGDLHLRHWFMATPVSSLWTPLGSFLSGRACVDRDNILGYSVPKQMPRCPLSLLIYHAIYSQFINRGANFGIDSLCPDLLTGNLTYAFHRDGFERSKSLLSFDELFSGWNTSYMRNVENFTADEYDQWPIDYFNHIGSGSRFKFSLSHDNDDAEIDYRIYMRDRWGLLRKSSVFPWWWTGIVIRNSDELRLRFMKHSVSGNNVNSVTTFPTPSECPYVVMFVRNMQASVLTSDSYNPLSPHANHGAPVNSEFLGGLEFFPLTMRMFQGDTDIDLYRYGFRNDVSIINVPTGFVASHPYGTSSGWSLSSDDSYFTGDLSNTPFDYSAFHFTQDMSLVDGEAITDYVKFYACGMWSRRFKRLRKLFIGLGNQFNPFDDEQMTPWKYLSYYKSWFDNFYPKRDIQYYQTPLARFTNFLSYHSKAWIDDFIEGVIDVQSISAPYFKRSEMKNFSDYRDFIDILYACADAKYLMPMDYFTLADLHPLETESDFNSQDNGLTAYTGVSDNPLSYSLPSSTDKESDGSVGSLANISADSTLNAWAVKMADKMLSYLTKRRVVGKSVSDTMRALFGAVDEHDKAHESTWCFGTASTNVKISAVMSQAETEEMHLGDFAGRGLGGSSSKTFKIDNNADLLVVLVMSALVPRLGYYQGDLRENSIGLSPNDFCKTIYDACGYDDVLASEYIADIMHHDNTYPSYAQPWDRKMTDINGHILGLVPRYTWYKVARDIVNADISLPSTKASMSPYVFTRDVDKGFSLDPLEMRTIDPDSFNKIFNESSSLDDHFILQLGFDVNLFAPLKSIATSFDDFDSDEDGTIEVEHS